MDVRVLDLRYFVAVAEELSFSRAASERLFVSQPALSKQIRQLERTLRSPLFERDRRSVTLTAAGTALLPLARQIIEGWENAERAVAAAAAAEHATLTVGFQTSIARGLIPAIRMKMLDLLPAWTLRFRQISWDDPTTGLGTNDVDVAIVSLPFPDGAGFSTKIVTAEDRWVAMPAGHPLTDREVVEFADLESEPFVALPPGAGRLRDFWLANDQRSRPARIGAEAKTADESFEAVASGLGVTLVSSSQAAMYRRDDIAYRPVAGLPRTELAVVWRTADHRQAVRVFVDACCICSATRLTPPDVAPPDVVTLSIGSATLQRAVETWSPAPDAPPAVPSS